MGRGADMQTAILDHINQTQGSHSLRRIVVAYDASPAAERALHDAIALAMRFGAALLLARVNPPQSETTDNYAGLRDEQVSQANELGVISNRLTRAGVSSRVLVRGGIVGDTLFNICCEENADLLLLGAYGYGLKDRQTLGSTAEFLLRAVPCPTLTYGPCVGRTFDDPTHKGPILLPISLPCAQNELQRAIAIAKLFKVSLEVLHVIREAPAGRALNLEHQCEQIVECLRAGGIGACWSLYSGSPEILILGRALEIDSPFILMPLKWKNRLSSTISDNIAAHIVRAAHIPVMTYRVA
jgi:nucleotide-binding universal stress UspA family protein